MQYSDDNQIAEEMSREAVNWDNPHKHESTAFTREQSRLLALCETETVYEIFHPYTNGSYYKQFTNDNEAFTYCSESDDSAAMTWCRKHVQGKAFDWNKTTEQWEPLFNNIEQVLKYLLRCNRISSGLFAKLLGVYLVGMAAPVAARLRDEFGMKITQSRDNEFYYIPSHD